MGARAHSEDSGNAAKEGGIMPWHLSKSDPRKVYDSYHNMVCVCQTSDQARLIVEAVKAHGSPQAEPIKLREPAVVPDATADAGPLDTFEPEEGCCGREIAKAGRAGVLKSLLSWDCPMCGCAWTPQTLGSVRHWTPQPAAIIFR